MRYTLLGILLLLSIDILAQKNFYLADVDTNDFGNQKKYVDSVLTLYHKAKSDTAKLNYLFELVNNVRFEIYKYKINKIFYQKSKELITNKSLPIGLYQKIKKYYATALFYLAEEYLFKSEIDSAVEYYQKAQKIYEEVDEKTGIADCYAQLGYISLIYNGDPFEAIENYKKSYQIYTQTRDTENIAFALNSLAYIYQYIGEMKQALEYYDKALELAQKMNDLDRLAILFNNLAKIYYDINDTTNAIKFFKLALEYYEKTDNFYGIAVVLNNLGNIYVGKDLDSSLMYFRRAIKVSKKYQYLNNLALIYNNLSDIYFEILNDVDSSKFYSYKSLEIYKQTNEISGLVYSYIRIGRIYLMEKNYDQALKYIENACKLAENSKILDLQKRCYKAKYQYFRDIGNFKKAFEFQNLYFKFKDSALNENIKKEILSQQLKYEYEKREAINKAEYEKKISILKEKKKRQTLIAWFSSILTILVIFIAYFIYNRWKQIKEKNEIINKQRLELKQYNKRLTDSIIYAQRIQAALLPQTEILKKYFQEYFVIYLPRNIVSGDFYWIKQIKNYLYIAVADCTGHGVPGAFMSMLGISYFNEIAWQSTTFKPSEILQQIKNKINSDLKYENPNQIDSIDVSLLRIDLNNLNALWAGANRPLILIKAKDKKLLKFKGTRQTVGYNFKNLEFNDIEFNLKKNDLIYLFTDGITDQLNKNYKKITLGKFIKFLEKIANFDLNTQKEKITEFLFIHKSEVEQTDDITILAIKI